MGLLTGKLWGSSMTKRKQFNSKSKEPLATGSPSIIQLLLSHGSTPSPGSYLQLAGHFVPTEGLSAVDMAKLNGCDKDIVHRLETAHKKHKSVAPP